jgi:hypothetical protein
MSDYIDTRDLVKRLDEIDTEVEEAQETQDADTEKELRVEQTEIEAVEDYCEDFRHGETLIPEDEFQEYARELAEDIGAIDRDAVWPLGCIDWKQAADELAMDYTLIEYRGQSFYVR